MNELIKYQTDHGEVELSPSIIRQYLVPSGTAVSDQEIKLFLELCKYQGLNPFLREVYLVKYGTSPASMVTGKEVFTKRAMANPKFAGLTAGITVVGKENKLYRREGSLLLPGETLIGGWAKVHIKEYAVPFFDEVSLNEYTGTGPLWKSKPATMVRKVAIVHALREAFPEQFEGLYSQEEINTIDASKLPTGAVQPVQPVQPDNADDASYTDYLEQPDAAEDPAPQQNVAPATPPQPAQPATTAKAPYPQATAPDDVGSFKSPFFKKYPGKTLREIYNANSGYVKFMGENGKDPAIREIIKKFLATVEKAQPVKDITPIEDEYGAPPPDNTDLPFNI